MAKKHSQSPKSASNNATPGFFDAVDNWLPWALGFAAFGLYSIGFGNKMVELFDEAATLTNPAVREFQIFNGFNLGMYAPLTWIGYQIAYTIGKDAPNAFHFLSALIHAINVALAFRLLRRLDFNTTTAGVAAAFFALHPLQVESVAWIAAFSTPLFALFSLLAMQYYLQYTESGVRGRAWWMSLAMFVLACMAKPFAVALPLSLLAIDYWKKRGLSQAVLLEKAPYALISLGFGALAVYARQFAGELNQPSDFSILDRALMVCQSITLYWTKLLLPFGLSAWYPFEKLNGGWSWEYYAAPVIVLLVLWLGWRNRKEYPVLWFGLMFYLANIIFTLPWASFGAFEPRADRYNYLASLGFFTALAALPDILKAKKPSWVNTVWLLFAVLIFIWLMASGLRIRTWKDSMTLIGQSLAARGDNFGKAYLWRGMAYNQASDAQKALKDFSQAVQINPMLYEAYKFRGNIFGMMKNYQQSVEDLNKFLEKYPDEVPELYNRGLSMANLNRNEDAIADFSKAISIDSSFVRLFRARGNCYKKTNQYEKAIADLTVYLNKFTNEPAELYNRGVCYAGLNKNEEAIADLTKAIKIDPKFPDAYLARGNCYKKMGDEAKANSDLQQWDNLARQKQQ